MKLNKIIKLSFILILAFIFQSLILVNTSNAVLESNKANDTTSKTLNGALEQCYEMRNSSSSLGNHSGLEPHLATPKDVGIAVFLGFSSYGAATGPGSPTINIARGENPTLGSGDNWTTTTGNMTGIIQLGSNQEHMAALTPNLADSSNTNLLYDSKYNKYINMVTRNGATKEERIEETKGMTLDEITKDNGYYFGDTSYGISYDTNRILYFSAMNGRVGNTSNKSTTIRYRPVIWN